MSLKKQETEKRFEIIVVDSSTDGTEALLTAENPRFRMYHFTDRLFPGKARNFGISVSEGDILAMIDADCRAEPGWIEEVAKAHQSDSLAVGGAIANGNPESLVGWAAYFCEFSRWMPRCTPVPDPSRIYRIGPSQADSYPSGPCRPEWMDDIAAANVSYKRAAFKRFGPFLEDGYCSDTDFHWRMGKEGHRLRFTPSIRVFHQNIDGLGRFLRHEIFHGQCFSRMRIKAQKFSPWKRTLYTALSFFIPFKLMMEISVRNIKNRIYLRHFLKSSPLLFLGVSAWSLGEMLGYLHD
jgi:GT2 family glycosyltransferase